MGNKSFIIHLVYLLPTPSRLEKYYRVRYCYYKCFIITIVTLALLTVKPLTITCHANGYQVGYNLLPFCFKPW